ncbi:hypothetical protein ACFSO0_04745 [Brevibacillus sp. GCM10020057]|uniref:hypothetical protein n=1 Tax=Brevibacillus sp. GCM10020057 TaxID=3317327 RepID=UPI00363A0F08
MKRWNRTASVLVAASLLASPAAVLIPASVYASSIDKKDVEVIPLPEELVKVLKDLKEDYVPALGNLHTDAFVKDGGEYRIALSDKKSKITAGVSLDLAVDEQGNITYLKLNDPVREKAKPFAGDVPYQKAVNFIREQVALDHSVAAQGYRAADRGTEREGLLVVPFYPTLGGVPVKKELGYVAVDADGQVVQFYQKKQKLPLASKVADPKKAVPAGQAQKAWETALSMKLVYDQETGKLVYVPENEPLIDAMTGTVVFDLQVTERDSVTLKGTASKDWWKDRGNMEKVLTQGLQLAPGRLKYDFVTDGDKKSDIDVHEWTAVAKESARIVLDRKSRAPLRIEVEGQAAQEREQPLSVSAGRKLAVQFVETYLLDKEQSFEVKATSLNEQLPAWVDQTGERLKSVQRYDFYPEVDGIATKTPLYTVEIDPRSGKVVFAKAAAALPLPSHLHREGLIGEKSAKEAFLAQVKLLPCYLYPKAGNQTAQLPQLVYAASEDSLSRAIDAYSGSAVRSWLLWEE